MKYSILLILCLFSFSESGFAQRTAQNCPIYKTSRFGAYIPGYRDTTLNDQPALVIDGSLLREDIELKLRDTSFRVESFTLFLDNTSNGGESVYEIKSTGSKAAASDMRRAARASPAIRLVMVDDIVIRRGGVCYKIPELRYYCNAVPPR